MAWWMQMKIYHFISAFNCESAGAWQQKAGVKSAIGKRTLRHNLIKWYMCSANVWMHLESTSEGKKNCYMISRGILDFTDSFSQLSKRWKDKCMCVVWEKACYCWWLCCWCCGWWWGMSCMSRGWFTLSHKLQTVSGNSDWGDTWNHPVHTCSKH